MQQKLIFFFLFFFFFFFYFFTLIHLTGWLTDSWALVLAWQASKQVHTFQHTLSPFHLFACYASTCCNGCKSSQSFTQTLRQMQKRFCAQKEKGRESFHSFSPVHSFSYKMNCIRVDSLLPLVSVVREWPSSHLQHHYFNYHRHFITSFPSSLADHRFKKEGRHRGGHSLWKVMIGIIRCSRR